MKDPCRLLDGGATDDELALLRAADSEEPSEAGKQRLAVALGVGSGVFGAATSASASNAVFSTLKVGASKLGLKWLIVGGVAVLGAVAVRSFPSGPAPRERVVAAAAPRAISGNSIEKPAAVGAQAPSPPKELAVSPSMQRAQKKIGAPPVSNAPVAASAPPASRSIAGEIEQLDLARASLRAGQPGKALKALGEYDRRYPAGALRQEATLLRIEALSGAGDLVGARRVADRFLRDNPRTPHERRIRALVRDPR